MPNRTQPILKFNYQKNAPGQLQFHTTKRITLNTCRPGGFQFPLHSSFGFAGIIILTDAEKVLGHARMHLEESGGAWGESACASVRRVT